VPHDFDGLVPSASDTARGEERRTIHDSRVQGMTILGCDATPGGSIHSITAWDGSMTSVLLSGEY